MKFFFLFCYAIFFLFQFVIPHYQFGPKGIKCSRKMVMAADKLIWSHFQITSHDAQSLFVILNIKPFCPSSVSYSKHHLASNRSMQLMISQPSSANYLSDFIGIFSFLLHCKSFIISSPNERRVFHCSTSFQCFLFCKKLAIYTSNCFSPAAHSFFCIGPFSTFSYLKHMQWWCCFMPLFPLKINLYFLI